MVRKGGMCVRELKKEESPASPARCCFVLNSELYPVQAEKRSLQLVFLNAQRPDAMSRYYYCCAMNEVGRALTNISATIIQWCVRVFFFFLCQNYT